MRERNPVGAVGDKSERVALCSLSLSPPTNGRPPIKFWCRAAATANSKKIPRGSRGKSRSDQNLLALVLSALAAVLATLVALARILLLLAGLLAAALLLSAVTALLILLAGLLLATLAGLIVLAHGLLLLRAHPAIRQRSSGGICFLVGAETGHLSNICSCRIGASF
jgi:hypothetical protein